ncbi:zinc metalloprotease [Shewanella olleyana]|uniref:zinc metalloprotease n=1 Tax=Shewanella olleyana TaxID=135626 RepID=UPI00200DBF21|nr:zinc metalloprotease [Shewanella olleyana]MCL1066897.1 zinc metalloprotease [Shewanella olleyana]
MSYKINNKDFGSIEEFVMQGRGCATTTPNHYQIRRNDNKIARVRSSGNRGSGAIIPVKFIHIKDGELGEISESQRIQQIEVLNEAYSSFGLTFTYDPSSVVNIDNAEWYRMDHGSWAERDAKRALHSNPRNILNFYTAGLSEGLLGWATFPWELDGDPERDGVVMLAETLPGGNATNFNLGKTAVHEVGHWLGLWHTFQGGCDAYGDHVGDTSAHQAPNYGKPERGERHNACSSETNDAPIHNYMNYVDDQWMDEFTSGQVGRIYDHLTIYRQEFLS